MTLTWRRRVTSQIAVGLCALSVIVALIPLGFILFFVLSKGIQALNLNFFTKMPVPVSLIVPVSVTEPPMRFCTTTELATLFVMLPL